jgi:hypothetical protein
MESKDFSEKLEMVAKLEEHLGRGDYVTAATGIEMLPDDIDKNPLYAHIAVKIALNLDKLQNNDSELSELGKEVLRDILETYKGKCDYFNKK